jgi:hypothetical protein
MDIFYCLICKLSFRRAEIEEHHGPNGLIDLLRATGALGKTRLDRALQNAYPQLKDGFNYSSCAAVLAASILTKSQIILYSNVEKAIPHQATVKDLQADFRAEETRTPRDQR